MDYLFWYRDYMRWYTTHHVFKVVDLEGLDVMLYNKIFSHTMV
jgi:hypothetical protein